MIPMLHLLQIFAYNMISNYARIFAPLHLNVRRASGQNQDLYKYQGALDRRGDVQTVPVWTVGVQKVNFEILWSME